MYRCTVKISLYAYIMYCTIVNYSNETILYSVQYMFTFVQYLGYINLYIQYIF